MKDRAIKQVIRLELLRHGAPHSQLLSPGTPYLALCGNHGVHGFHVPLDHADYLVHREGLGYRNDAFAADVAMRSATRAVSQILAGIPALAAELTTNGTDVVHLRLVLSAAELAALPFELAESPPGTAAEGRSLLLDGRRQVVLTREARRVAPTNIQWPRRPRILFVCANPGGTPPVPVDAHMLALRSALDPWIGWQDAQLELPTHVTVVTNASLPEIERVCRTAACDRHGPFTHVHVLAHGVERPGPGSRDTRHYLALHRDEGSSDVEAVDGRRLEEALRPLPASRDALAVVTLASCESGDSGSILAGGASIAHELHESGIPFVVASQFPLTYRGSVRMVERLYDELLRGMDPVMATHKVRRELHSLERTHDWASMVVYAALPPDIDAQVLDARFHRTRKAGDVALARAVHGLHEPKDAAKDVDCVALDQAAGDIALIADERPEHAAHAYGWLASIAVRWAEAIHATRKPPSTAFIGSGEGASRLSLMGEDQALRQALCWFERAFDADRRLTWAFVQALTLRWAVERTHDLAEWTAARCMCARDEASYVPAIRAAYHDNMAQLCVMSPIVWGTPEDEATLQVKRHVDALLTAQGACPYLAFTVRRQMRRHGTWWSASSDVKVAMVGRIALAMDQYMEERGVYKTWHER